MLDGYYQDQLKSLGQIWAGIVTGIVIGSIPFVIVILIT